jgi:hypothetical protein
MRIDELLAEARGGLVRATDMEGGFQGWRAAGLPVDTD